MKSKKLLSVLTAVALSGGAVTTTAIVSPSIVSAAETTFSLFDSTSYSPEVFSDGAVMVRLTPSSGQLHV